MRPLGLLFPLALVLSISACEPPTAVNQTGFDAISLLSEQANDGYARAVEPRLFQFPADHGAHPEYRNEWWYLTGNLDATHGQRFGFQVTFFRSAISHEPPPGKSAWSARHIWMAHVALTDVAAGEHRAEERFSREGPGLAGASLAPFRVWLEDWALSGNGDGFPWQIEIAAKSFKLDLRFDPMRQPILQGQDGLSQKSDAQGNASYYYSMPRLKTQGTIVSGDQEYRVSGLSWLDREWSTSSLGEHQAGWDWFALQFDDGSDLMYYRLRRKDGSPDKHSSGSWIGVQGIKTTLASDDLTLDPLEWWAGPDGRRIPIHWRLELTKQQRAMIVQAVLPDQYMDLTGKYWEGAVDVLDPNTKQRIGRGYLEMTGY